MLMPSAETLQVFVLSGFVQLILSLSLHLATNGSYAIAHRTGELA